MDVGDWMVGWYENEQKVGRRDVRAKALSWDDEWDKAEKWLQKNRPFAIIYFSLNERAVATVCLPHAIKGLSFQHIWLTHKALSFFIPMVGEFLNMNPHSRCTPGKKNSLLKMPMSGKKSHKSYVLFQRGFLLTGFEAKRIYFSTCRKK